ncbi:hypothetical protein Sipo8835_19980 [Streptomyces ipomoeae]|uniref:Uncharacterized protein n=1 Tax=Streptomyces ipomoeae TaxID=103232 RepID=A0A540QUK3_9ACTN|nr:hypothetical protein SipoB123_17695 [Streptomyces ipomoeae]TQE32604.1 hypothetical protein Sipo8835_19980 [Streptomyces ipomoeae]TQE39180.1 hypothetical protein Sipo7851_04405 [Streptomyces ipomoeae]
MRRRGWPGGRRGSGRSPWGRGGVPGRGWPRLPAEGAHAHGVAQAGGLGAAWLDAVAQLPCLRQLPQELGPAPPASGVAALVRRLRVRLLL